HQLPYVEIVDWLKNIRVLLIACRQLEFAEKLEPLILMRGVDEEDILNISVNYKNNLRIGLLNFRINIIRRFNLLLSEWNVPNRRNGLPSISLLDFCVRLFRWIPINKLLSLRSFLILFSIYTIK